MRQLRTVARLKTKLTIKFKAVDIGPIVSHVAV